jgi:hypothetical protein
MRRSAGTGEGGGLNSGFLCRFSGAGQATLLAHHENGLRRRYGALAGDPGGLAGVRVRKPAESR